MESVLNLLPGDILRYIIKYLDPVDCINLLSSDIWPITEELLLEKKDISLSHCYNLSPSSLKAYVNQCIDPTRIQSFNASHCHWLPSSLLVEVIQSLGGLKELYVEDTQLTLIHLGPIFLSCSQIKKISFSLRDVYLMDDQVIPYSMEDCLFNRVHFRQLTNIKLAWSEMFCSWPTVFEILGWCLSCVDLYLEQHFHHERFSQPDLEVIRRKQFPKLRWMENLNSFVYHQKGITHVSDPILQALCQWMFTELKFKNIERLWIPAEENQQVEIPRTIQSWNVGSILVNQPLNRFRELIEIGGIELDQVPSLPKLRMADGSFSAYRGLFEFVTRQPDLEQLFVKADIMQEFHYIGDIRLPQGFRLHKLRKLVYSCCILDPVVMDKLVELCPNLEEISMVSEEPFDFFEPFNLSATFLDRVSRLERLKKISIEGQISGNANVFEKIFGRCRHLETLILSGKHIDDDTQFLKSLCKALPLATNLRDLRIKWQHVTNIFHFKEMLAAIGRCRQLRLLHIDCWGMIGEDQDEIASLPEFIVDVVETLNHLISLSLQLKLNEWLLEKARIRIHAEILPLRPSFWFSNGLPMGDPILSITCLHCYEFGYDANESPCAHFRQL